MPRLRDPGLKRLRTEFPNIVEKVEGSESYQFVELFPYEGILFDVANFAPDHKYEGHSEEKTIIQATLLPTDTDIPSRGIFFH